MPTLATIDAYVSSGHALLGKFKAARLQCAWDILEEAPPVAKRVDWAQKIFADYTVDSDKEYRWWLSHPDVQTSGVEITDEACVTSVASFINDWATPDDPVTAAASRKR